MWLARQQSLDAAGGFIGTEKDGKEAQRCRVPGSEAKPNLSSLPLLYQSHPGEYWLGPMQRCEGKACYKKGRM